MSDETERFSGMSGDEEASYYEALLKGEAGTYDEWEEDRFRREAARSREEMKKLYHIAKLAPVGECVTCPVCRRHFTKRSYQQAFCCSKGRNRFLQTNCKDHYWSSVKEKRSIRAGGAKLW